MYSLSLSFPDWFMKTMGSQYVLSLVLFLYMFRLLGLALVGAYGPVWATLVVETLNGPCYGLGYTAIVIYASKLSPPGTSTTVQSVVHICYESLGEDCTVTESFPKWFDVPSCSIQRITDLEI